MTKLSKFIYWFMLVVCLTGITIGILGKDMDTVMDNIAVLSWVGVAWIMEKRCIKLQEKLDKLYGDN
jgi:hypothetical protein